MTIPWRETLETLLPQFQAYAAKAPGLNHLMVEVADHEREKIMGPNWFQPTSSNIPIVDGKPRYEKWDCSAFDRAMPGICPGYREARADESFDDDEIARVIRDKSGVVRAVFTPMKLRSGYFCGQPSEEVAPFKSLANSAAAALAGADDLHEHVYASDLTDIFRKPCGGVRYVFGDIPGVPAQFIARGWEAGCLQFENGVLIDVPIAESSPNANHWLFLLHRLGWRHIEGSGLRAERNAWNDNVEVSWEMLNQDWSHYPDSFSRQFTDVSPDSFYSVLGTKDAPLDVNLASVFAIQLLLTGLTPQSSSPQAEAESPTDYSREDWKLQELPALRAADVDESKDINQPRVGIMVATEVERKAVLKRMRPPKGKRAVLQVHSGSNTFFVGRLGVTEIVLCMTAMGSVGRDSSLIVTTETIDTWDLPAVIMLGIAFGKDASKQAIGNVLVSDRVIPYEPQRVGATANENRGSEAMAGQVLLNRFRNVIRWSFKAPDGHECGFQCGSILSGEKLVDNLEFKQELFDRYPHAIGGEMEGAGVAAAAERKRCEWIVVKSICDWGDGTKTKHHQEFAATASVSLVEHVLNQSGVLHGLVPLSSSSTAENNETPLASEQPVIGLANKLRGDETQSSPTCGPSTSKEDVATTVNVDADLERIKSEFADTRRSYPKMFLARLVGQLVDGETWNLIFGPKLILENTSSQSEPGVYDQYCIYADSSADETLARHGSRRFKTLCDDMFAILSVLPDEVLQLIDVARDETRSWFDWLKYMDAFTFRPLPDRSNSECRREQFHLLKPDNSQSGTSLVHMPLIAWMNSGKTLGESAFDHRWLATISPDICSYSEAIIGQIRARIPDFSKDFEIKQWKKEDGSEETWTVYHDDLSQSLDDDLGIPTHTYRSETLGVGSSNLIPRLSEIETGRDSAGDYHQTIAKILEKLFHGDLSGMEIERELHEGRKRIDICFENTATDGFFHHLKVGHQIKCPIVFVECKNYSSDPNNPELDQLTGRFGKQRGNFGLLVCRAIEDREAMTLRCKDIVNDDRGYVLVLDDQDIETLWTAKLKGNKSEFDAVLNGKFKEIIL